MNSKNIYETSQAKELSLDTLLKIFGTLDVRRLFFKKLASNDNSKNQVYLAGHFTDLGFIPTGELIPSNSTSTKTTNPKRKIKFTADLNFAWVSSDGTTYPAPTAKLIYYPQFPEVRLSGFLLRCKFDMAGWMDPAKKGRSPGRVLFFGVKDDGQVFAYLAVPDSRIAKEIDDFETLEISGILGEVPDDHFDQYRRVRKVAESHELYKAGDLFPTDYQQMKGSKQRLLAELRRIHLKGPIPGQRLDRNGNLMPYSAQNGGGYTLEAELGVTPNGFAEPDFHGWEVKQFGVPACDRVNSKPLTIMTPEPDGGLYSEQGVEAFIRKYGYENANDRLDFTGRHFLGSTCTKTGLTLVAHGFDSEAGQISDATGFIGLIDSANNVASSWAFSKLLGHWKRKHARAAYVPSVASPKDSPRRTYSYCKVVKLFEGTDFERLLRAFDGQAVYYDPGINIKAASTKPIIRRRSQFRIKSSSLKLLYETEESVDVLDIES